MKHALRLLAVAGLAAAAAVTVQAPPAAAVADTTWDSVAVHDTTWDSQTPAPAGALSLMDTTWD